MALASGSAASPGPRPTAGSRGLSYQAVAGGANGLGAVGTPIPSGLTEAAPDGDEVVDWPQAAAAVAPPTKSARASLAPEPSHPGLARSNSFTSPLDLRRAAQNGAGSRSSPSINPHLGTIGSPRTPEPAASPVAPAPIGSEQQQASLPQRPPADFDLAAGLSSLRVGATTPEVEPVGPAASAIQPPSYPPFSPPQPTMNYGFQTAPAHLWSPPTAPSQLPHGLPAFGFPSPDTYGAQLPSMGYYGAPAPPQHASAFMGLGLGIGGIGLGGRGAYEQPGQMDHHRSPTWSSAIQSPRMAQGAVGMQRSPSGPSLGSTFGVLTSPYDSPYAATMMSSQMSAQSHDSRRSSQGMHAIADPSGYGALTLSDHWGQMSPFASGMVGIPSLGGYGLPPGGQPSHYGLYGPTTPSAHAAAMYQASLNRPIRSAVLEDFRLNRHRRWEIEDLRDHICEFSQDQIGSRHVQQRLDTASITERQIVFDEIMPNLLTLSTDVFANYVRGRSH